MQFAAHPGTVASLTTLLRSVMPPFCLENGAPTHNLSLASYCLACVQAFLEQGAGMLEIAEQAKDADLARCLLRFLKWDNEKMLAEGGSAKVSVENYGGADSNTLNNCDEKSRISVRVYSVAVVKILLNGKHSNTATEATIISDV